jgi:predicted nucleotidyltransferase
MRIRRTEIYIYCRMIHDKNEEYELTIKIYGNQEELQQLLNLVTQEAIRKKP